jgi:hypothetical protein
MSKGIAGHTAKRGRNVLLIITVISIAVVGAYVAYPYSNTGRAMMGTVGRSAAAVGLAGFFTWTQPDQ